MWRKYTFIVHDLQRTSSGHFENYKGGGTKKKKGGPKDDFGRTVKRKKICDLIVYHHIPLSSAIHYVIRDRNSRKILCPFVPLEQYKLKRTPGSTPPEQTIDLCPKYETMVACSIKGEGPLYDNVSKVYVHCP
ncbi:hypothetical protein CDAR_586571 [Caerostris darwini]|uniref:Uncharacterized protein n=1 Tax=Caerostris darwini TaxID=1538125 RepID=A0AAV4QB63_9ARAC|nr:hypothetical protein CDAR_586571 [Caerostris darwini]